MATNRAWIAAHRVSEEKRRVLRQAAANLAELQRVHDRAAADLREAECAEYQARDRLENWT